MGRIIGFIGAKPGVGATTLCLETAKRLSRRGVSVCLVDFYFTMNDLTFNFYDETKFDLKDFLIGKISFDGILNQFEENLYYIKSDSISFDYLRFGTDIKKLIEVLSFKFDYVLIDVNSFDFKNLSLASGIISEACIIFDNNLNSIRLSLRLYKKLRDMNTIDEINFIFNKSKIIGQLHAKNLKKNEIEKLINEDIFFELPLFYNNNKKSVILKNKILNIFCNAIITNKSTNVNYHKKYTNLIGKLKARVYAKFERD